MLFEEKGLDTGRRSRKQATPEITASYGCSVMWMKLTIAGLDSSGDEGQAQMQSQNREPDPAPGFLPGSRIVPQPVAAKASLQMHLPK